MAYQQKGSSVSRWFFNLRSYKPHAGEWAWLLHRITGIGLTVYLFLHISTLRTLTQGEAAYNATAATFLSPIFKFFEWALFSLVVFHSFNGLRIVLVDFAGASRYHKIMLRAVYAISLLLMIFMAYLIFGNPFEVSELDSLTLWQWVQQLVG